MGSGGFGTDYRYRNPETGQLNGEQLPIDFTANAASLGAHAIRATTRQDLQQALESARAEKSTSVIVVEVDKELRVPGYESWWDVAIAEISESEAVRQARADYEESRKNQRLFL